MTLQSHRGRTRSSIERCDLAKLQREDRVLNREALDGLVCVKYWGKGLPSTLTLPPLCLLEQILLSAGQG